MTRFRLERREGRLSWSSSSCRSPPCLWRWSCAAASSGSPAPTCSTPTALLFLSTFQTAYDIEDTLVKAAPLLFTGLAVAVAFRAKFWNIGAEGQLMAGAIVAGFIGERSWLPGLQRWCR